MFTMVVIQCNDSTLTVCGCFGSLWVSRVAIDKAYDTFIVSSAIINPPIISPSIPSPNPCKGCCVWLGSEYSELRRTTKSGINSAKHTETQSESWLSVCLSRVCLWLYVPGQHHQFRGEWIQVVDIYGRNVLALYGVIVVCIRSAIGSFGWPSLQIYSRVDEDTTCDLCVEEEEYCDGGLIYIVCGFGWMVSVYRTKHA